jgi:hypothetical protein
LFAKAEFSQSNRMLPANKSIISLTKYRRRFYRHIRNWNTHGETTPIGSLPAGILSDRNGAKCHPDAGHL